MDTTNPNESNDTRPESGLTEPAPETLPDASSEVTQRLPGIEETPPRETCPNCGAEIASGAKFCGRCGAATGQCCSRCGAKPKPGVKFCGECGAPLAGSANHAPPVPQAASGPMAGAGHPGQRPPRPVGFIEAWKRGWTLRVKGRASRGEYWWRMLGLLIEWAALSTVVVSMAMEGENPWVVFGLLCIAGVVWGIPLTCLCIRRLHDRGMSGWWVLLWNIRPVGLIFSLLPGTPGPNAYGPVPESDTPEATPESEGVAAGRGEKGSLGENLRKRIRFAAFEFEGKGKTALCILSAVLAVLGVVCWGFGIRFWAGKMFTVFTVLLPFAGFPLLLSRKTAKVGWVAEGVAALVGMVAFFCTLRFFDFPLALAVPLFWVFHLLGARRCRNVCAWIMVVWCVLECSAPCRFLTERFFFAGYGALWALIALLERGEKGENAAARAAESGPGVTGSGEKPAKLIGVTESIKGCEIPLDANGETSLGREADNTVMLEHSSVSRHHCVFAVREGKLTLRDLGSTNGTRVNSRPVTEEGVALRNKDLVQIGAVEFTVEAPEPVGAAPLPEGKRVATPKGGCKGKAVWGVGLAAGLVVLLTVCRGCRVNGAGKTVIVGLPGGAKMEMVWCPADSDGRPQGFWIAKTEVTQEQWESVMGKDYNRSGHRGANLPVENVSYWDCRFFTTLCTRGVRDLELRLPTQLEWEHACTAGSSLEIGGTGRLDDMGWFDGNSGGETHPVGTKHPNAWGIHDMHGNVAEWAEMADDLKVTVGGHFRDNRSGCFGTYVNEWFMNENPETELLPELDEQVPTRGFRPVMDFSPEQMANKRIGRSISDWYERNAAERYEQRERERRSRGW